jgi:hypothetical protein
METSTSISSFQLMGFTPFDALAIGQKSFYQGDSQPIK